MSAHGRHGARQAGLKSVRGVPGAAADAKTARECVAITVPTGALPGVDAPRLLAAILLGLKRARARTLLATSGSMSRPDCTPK